MSVSGPIGLVAGSGIDLLPLLAKTTGELPFSEVLGLDTSVVGHEGRFVFGQAASQVPLVIQCGRLHLYEGMTAHQVQQTVSALAQFGVDRIVFTNAAGGLLPEMKAGDLSAATVVHSWPCRHSPPHDPLQCDFVLPGADHQGPFWWMHGPCYETRAEIEALRQLGGASVGMSTALELAKCKAMDIPAAVISVITNVCGSGEKLSHEHVIENAHHANQKLQNLLLHWLEDMTTHH